MTRVAIIGGIGGLTAASALSQAGSRCFTEIGTDVALPPAQ
jgi:cation diffusion facilitator CzcD-associated flavoprotein CzcO